MARFPNIGKNKIIWKIKVPPNDQSPYFLHVKIQARSQPGTKYTWKLFWTSFIAGQNLWTSLTKNRWCFKGSESWKRLKNTKVKNQKKLKWINWNILFQFEKKLKLVLKLSRQDMPSEERKKNPQKASSVQCWKILNLLKRSCLAWNGRKTHK